MYKVQFTLEDDSPLTIYFANTLSVCTNKNSNTRELEVRVMDGNHNNGGWSVQESYAEVTKRIDNAIVFRKILSY